MAKRTGTSGPDTDQTIRPTSKNDVIRTLDGDDNVTGGRGNDRIDGGRGNDVLAGQEGKDTLRGGAGDDTLRGGIGKDKLDGGPGNDTLFGDEGKDSLRGGPGSDHFIVTSQREARDYNPNEDEITVLNAGPVERPREAAPPAPGPREVETPPAQRLVDGDDNQEVTPTKLPDYLDLLDRMIEITGSLDKSDFDTNKDGDLNCDDDHPYNTGDQLPLKQILDGNAKEVVDPSIVEAKDNDESEPDRRADLMELSKLFDENPARLNCDLLI